MLPSIICRRFQNVNQKIISVMIQLNKSINTSIYNTELDQSKKWTSFQSNHAISSNFNYNNCRCKYTKGSTKDDESDSDDEIHEFKDEKDSKVVKMRFNSLRADLVIKAGLGIARNKVEVIFYESKIRLNGKKLSKKSLHLNIGDEIDVIKGYSDVNPSHLNISRVTILSATDKGENISVILRRFKNLLIENYVGADAWKGGNT